LANFCSLGATPLFGGVVERAFDVRVQCVKVFADGMGNRMAWATAFGAFIAVFFNTAALYMVVERAKKCLDFGSTLYGWHILLCVAYDGLPLSWEWWICTIGACVMTIVVGEYACARREMRDITIFRGA